MIRVGNLRRETGSEKDFTISAPRLEIELRGDLFVFNEVLVKGQAKNVGGKIYVNGSVKAKADITCSCCLMPYNIQIDTSFEETYYAASSIDSSDLDDTGRIYTGDEIDLREAIIESLILTLPMKLVCRPDCKGLCPACGCDLNTDRCNCNPQAPDPRLASLGELLPER